MSKDYLKEFLAKFSEVESCDSKENSACDIVGNLNNNLNKMDLRFNKNKEKVLTNIQKLQNKENCSACDATDGVFSDLANIWKKNKLKY